MSRTGAVLAALVLLCGAVCAQQAQCNGEDAGAPSLSQFGVSGDQITIQWPPNKNTSKLPTSLEWIDNRSIDGTYTIHETFGDGSERTFSMDDESFRNQLADLCGGSRPWHGEPAWHFGARPRPGAASAALAPAGFASRYSATGDLNGDGAADSVAVFNLSLYVTLRDKNGNQISQNRIDLPAAGASLILKDVNHDGQLDILVALLDSPGGVGVLLGNGDGTFKPVAISKAGPDSTSLAAADFNNDQKMDVAVATGNGVAILLGNGDGSFQTPVNYTAGMLPVSLVAADFNGDGYVDLAVADALEGTVSVLFNSGHGSFGTAISSLTSGPPSPAALAYADLNGDGNLDLAVAYKYSSTVAIVLGDGKGSFQSPVMYAAGAYPGSVVLLPSTNGEFTMLTEDDLGQALVVTAGTPQGTAMAPVLQFAGGQLGGAVMTDVNRDGNLDVVLTDVQKQNLLVLAGNGTGVFAQSGSYPFSNSTSGTVVAGPFAMGDLNGDGIPDVVLPLSSGVGVMLSQAHGVYGPLAAISTTASSSAISLADFNGDGRLDAAAVSANRVTLLLGNGDGSFRMPIQIGAPGVAAVAIADFNGDGIPDLFIGGTSAEVLSGKGDGTFGDPIALSTGGMNIVTAAAGDLNGDGIADLAVIETNSIGDQIAVFAGKGDGTFSAIATPATEFGARQISIADLNGDGRPDLIVGHCCQEGDGTYLLGHGDGTFAPEVHIRTGPAPVALAVAANRGGRAEIVAAGNFSANAGSIVAFTNLFPDIAAVSAASAAGPTLAAGSIASAFPLFGVKFAGGTAAANGPPVATLAGDSIEIIDKAGNAVAAPLFYASPGQINFLIPSTVPAGPAAVDVKFAGATLIAPVTIAAVDPGLFTLDAAGLIAANVLRVASDGKQTYESVYQVDSAGSIAARPIPLGSSGDKVYLLLYGTGISGAPESSVLVTIGGKPATVLFSGPQSVFAGLDQVNVQIPTSLAGAGNVAIVLSAAGIPANIAHVTIQ